VQVGPGGVASGTLVAVSTRQWEMFCMKGLSVVAKFFGRDRIDLSDLFLRRTRNVTSTGDNDGS
jgi:hypothetical protein